MKMRLVLASLAALLLVRDGEVSAFAPRTTTTPKRTGEDNTKLAVVTDFSYWSEPSSTSAYSSYSSSVSTQSAQQQQADRNRNRQKRDPFANSSMFSNRDTAAGRSEQSNCYYRILGVPITADQAALKRAFRQLVKQYHPDANPDKDTTLQFQMINRAYQVLSDTHERQKYDARMGYRDDQPQHFIVSDMEDTSLRREQEHYYQQHTPFGDLSNDRTGSSWQVRDDGRMFLMDDNNDGIQFRM